MCNAEGMGGDALTLLVEQTSGCACVGAQVGPDDLRRNALVELLVQCCKRDAFHTLRTVEQLGYMVTSFAPPAAPPCTHTHLHTHAPVLSGMPLTECWPG